MIVFDMDGVLVEVTESYRETVIRTVGHFTGKTISNTAIQDYKNQGGWNNDWALSQRIIRDFGREVDYQTVVDRFNRFFWGNGDDGLILRELWIPQAGLLERLSRQHRLAIFTGRNLREAKATLQRFAAPIAFAPVMTSDVVKREKPAPDGLLDIMALHPGEEILYFGDTVDDARSARAAGVRFAGIAAPESPRHREIVSLLQAENAIAVLDNINDIEKVL